MKPPSEASSNSSQPPGNFPDLAKKWRRIIHLPGEAGDKKSGSKKDAVGV